MAETALPALVFSPSGDMHEETTKKEKGQVPVLEFKRLLHLLMDSSPDTGVRYRLMGEMWQPGYFRVLHLTDKGVALQDEQTRKLTLINDLSHVMEFELDQAFQQYQPHFHYSVDPAYVNF